MKIFSLKRFAMLGLCLTTVGCQQQEMSVDYLVMHPYVLEKQLVNCSNGNTANNQPTTPHCKMVFEAQSILRTFLQAEQADPERFGQRILDAEYDLVQLQTKLATANEEVQSLQMKNAIPAEQNVAKVARDKLQAAVKDKKREVDILLAVAGLNSPE